MSGQTPGALTLLVALLVVIFLQVPVLVVVLASFSETAYLTIPPQGWTTKWFKAVFDDPTYILAIKNSIQLAIGATVASLCLGTAATIAIHRRVLPGSDALQAFLMAPLVVPAVVIGVALLQYFTLLGMRGGFWVLLAAHIVITVPYVVRTTLASLSGMDQSVEEAARILGANEFTTFRLVTLPLIKPGLVAGALFAFVTSMENVPVTIFLAGPRDITLPILIFTSVEMGVDPSVAAVSTLLILVTVFVLFVAERWAGLHRFV